MEVRSQLNVQERLARHFRRLSVDILRDFQDGLHSGTPEAVANFREDFVREIVGRVFERTYRTSKGPIFDSFGGRSKSIDCVVCAPNHPLFLDPIARDCALLVDGIHSAIEIKPDISALPPSHKCELVRGLEQVRSCKRLRRTEPGMTKRMLDTHVPAMRDWLLRVPTHLFSMKASDLKRTAEYVAAYYTKEQVPLCEQFDYVVVLGIGMLEMLKAPKKNFSNPVILVRHLKEDARGNFLFRTATCPGPEMRMSVPLMARYLNGVFDKHTIEVVPTFGTFPQ